MARMNPDQQIKVILFDADGVIQTTHPPFLEKLAAIPPDGDSSVEEFVREVAALERSAHLPVRETSRPVSVSCCNCTNHR